MPVIRTYRCDDCQTEFEVTCESGSNDPSCPTCSIVLQWVPRSFAITGIKSKALDVTQKIMEEQYGFSNFKDKTEPGETVVLPPAQVATAEKDRVVQEVACYAQQAQGVTLTPQQAEMAAGFWGNKGAQQFPQMSAADVLASAKGAAAIAEREGANPMKALGQVIKQGKRPRIDVVARAKM